MVKYLSTEGETEKGWHVADHDFRSGSLNPCCMVVLENRTRTRTLSLCEDELDNYRDELIWRYKGHLYINLYKTPKVPKKKKNDPTPSPAPKKKGESKASRLLLEHIYDMIIKTNAMERTRAPLETMVLMVDNGPDTNPMHHNTIKLWYLAVGECMHSQIWNNSGSNSSINVIFCESIEQILNNYFMKFYQICV